MKSLKLALFAAMAPAVLFSAEFLPNAKWNTKAPASVELKQEKTLTFQMPKTETALKFINFHGNFNAPVDLSKLEKVSLKLKGNVAIPVGLSFFCGGGYYQTAWSNAKTGKEETVIEFAREAFSNYKTPDLTQAKLLIVNLGLWACDTTKQDMEITISSIDIVPAPAASNK